MASIASERVHLVIRSVGRCYLRCSFCNWEGEMDEAHLRGSSLELLLDMLMGEGFKPEAYFSCPDPLLHPDLSSLLECLAERGLRSTVLVPSRTRSGRASWDALMSSSEVFVFSTSVSDMRSSRELLRFLISNDLNVKLLLISETVREGELESAIGFAKDTGLELWVSPPLFRGSAHDGLRGIELGGLGRRWMGVYGVRVAFKGDFPIRLLEGPRCEPDCRLLYLTPKGRVGRCPFNAVEQALPSPLETISILREGCEGVKAEEKFRLVPSVKLVTREGEEIDERDLEILLILEESRSLSQAARILGTTPSSVLKRVRRMEAILGCSLMLSSRGGYFRGGVRLTGECEELIRRYRELKVSIFNRSRFSQMEKKFARVMGK
ncbi:MAG: LysR family transcriptional regulator [Candidatus Korarchaeum sp.]